MRLSFVASWDPVCVCVTNAGRRETKKQSFGFDKSWLVLFNLACGIQLLQIFVCFQKTVYFSSSVPKLQQILLDEAASYARANTDGYHSAWHAVMIYSIDFNIQKWNIHSKLFLYWIELIMRVIKT